MSATIYSVRIRLQKILVKDDCDWLGKGELYFLGTVGPVSTGRSKIFKVGDNTTIDLASLGWVWEFRVDKLASIPIVLKGWDEDLLWDDKLGTMSTTVAPPWDAKQYQTPSSSGKFVLVWDVANTVVVPAKAGVGYVSRQFDGSAYKSALAAPIVGVVEITDVAGLYKPGVDDRAVKPAGTTKNASYVPGYVSDDDRGRIFTNRLPDGTWTKDTQYVELTAEVFPVGVKLPADTRIVWTVDDPDDPTNEGPTVRKEAGQLLDPNDYTGGAKVAPNGNDNNPRGRADETPKLEQADAKYALSGTETLVDVATRISKVRFHTRDVAGDNYRIRADLKPHPGITLGVGFATGVMTVWHRIEVEYVRMASADELPVDEISQHYDIACVQVDIAEKRVVTGAADKPHMAAADPEADCAQYASAAGQFKNEGRKGWFFIAAANRMVKARKATILYEGDAVANADRVRLPPGTALAAVPAVVRVFDPAKAAGLAAPKPNDRGVHTKFKVTSLVGGRDLVLVPHDFHQVDDPNTAFLHADLSHYGIAAGTKIPVQVLSDGDDAAVVGGISPGGTTIAGKLYFGGKLLVFTKSVAAHEQIRTMCHELCHAFDNAHKCGNWDWVQQTDLTACCMNYWYPFVLDDASPRKPMPWTQNRGSADLCAHHIRNMRDYHLEKNPGLGWG